VHTIPGKENAVGLRDMDINRPISRNNLCHCENQFPCILIPTGFRNGIHEIDESSSGPCNSAGRKIRQLASKPGKARKRNRNGICGGQEDINSEHEFKSCYAELLWNIEF